MLLVHRARALRVGGAVTPEPGADDRARSARLGHPGPARLHARCSALHVIDNSTRTAFLTFLPFLLIAKGSSVQAVGVALMLVFAGGAAGELACGALAGAAGG